MKIKGLNAFQLKLFMALLMIFDHLGKIPGLLSGEWEGIFHALTRCVAVWFAFTAVEGFRYTRSRFVLDGRVFLLGNLIFFWFCFLYFFRVWVGVIEKISQNKEKIS